MIDDDDRHHNDDDDDAAEDQLPRIAKGGIMVLLRQLPCRVTQTLNIIESSHSVQMMIMIIIMIMMIMIMIN